MGQPTDLRLRDVEAGRLVLLETVGLQVNEQKEEFDRRTPELGVAVFAVAAHKPLAAFQSMVAAVTLPVGLEARLQQVELLGKDASKRKKLSRMLAD